MTQRLLNFVALPLLALCGLSPALAAAPATTSAGPKESVSQPAIDGRFTAEQAWMAETLDKIQDFTVGLTQREMVEIFARVMLGPSADIEEDPELMDIRVMDHDPAAYYERAPSKMSRRMRSTLEAACKADAAASIFCADIHVWILREVSELGHKTDGGFACAGVYARNKYFSPFSIHRNSGCVPYYCPEDEKLCSVSTERLLAATHYYSPSKPMKDDWLH